DPTTNAGSGDDAGRSSKKNRIEPWEYDKEMYKKRKEVERLFQRVSRIFRVLKTEPDVWVLIHLTPTNSYTRIPSKQPLRSLLTGFQSKSSRMRADTHRDHNTYT